MGNPEEAGVAKATTEEVHDAPPPYSEVDNRNTPMVAVVNPGPPPTLPSVPATAVPVPSDSKEALSSSLSPSPSPSASNSNSNSNNTSTSASASGHTTKFPPTLNAYYQKKVTRAFHLGPSGNQPLFAVKVHTGLTRHPEVELFDGPSEKDCPLLATARHDGRNDGSATLVTLPPLPGSGSAFSTSSEVMRAEWGLGTSSKHVVHRFSIEVKGVANGGGGGGGEVLRREDFEWRSSHGSEVKELTSWWSTGWKLVRLASQVEGASSSGGGDGYPVAESSSSSSSSSAKKQQRLAGVTSDGKEIVAVWALNTASLSMTKAFKFQFMGSGARGQLGERWEIMAVITALRLWYLVWQGRAHGPSGSGVGYDYGAAAARS